MPALTNKLHLVTWGDVFALVDYGEARPADYATLGALVIAGAEKYPHGVGALVIIPPNARPPSDDARIAMNNVLRKLGPQLRCLCWFVEGDGFQGAMVRGVLTGVRMFGRLAYETHVSSDLSDALTWLVTKLDGNDGRLAKIPEGLRSITEQRRKSEKERPPR